MVIKMNRIGNFVPYLCVLSILKVGQISKKKILFKKRCNLVIQRTIAYYKMVTPRKPKIIRLTLFILYNNNILLQISVISCLKNPDNYQFMLVKS